MEHQEHRTVPGNEPAHTLRSKSAIAPGARTRVGEYLLVAKLSEDALGAVYRAIHVGDGRFARLRLLESPELLPGAVFAAIQRKDAPCRARSFHPPGRRETLGIAEGRPYLAWHETSGWTLDAVLAAARGADAPMPVEGALKIVAGMAAALEHSRATVVDREPTCHGLVWPGFVTITRNAEVWVRGFGLASAVFPSLTRPRLSRLVAPYVAPEVRENGVVGESADVYALGALLLELLTGRHPSLQDGLPRFSPGDPFSEDVALLAHSAVADSPARLPSVVPFSQRVQKLLEDCPYEGSNADLALYLDDLLTAKKPAHARRSQAEAGSPGLSRIAPDGRVSERGAVRRVWALRVAAAFAAVATLVGVDLAARRRELPRAVASMEDRAALTGLFAATPQPVSPSTGTALAETLPSSSSGSLPARKALPVSRARLVVRPQPSQRAQVWRLRAALSRIAAQRVDASDLASEPFRAARVYEKEGERLLARRKFAAAHEAFEHAAELYLEAEELSHEERARVIRVSTLDERATLAPRPF